MKKFILYLSPVFITVLSVVAGCDSGATEQNNTYLPLNQENLYHSLLNSTSADMYGCIITASATDVHPGQPVTFTMTGNGSDLENAGFILGLSNSVMDLPATFKLIAPDVSTRYVLSVFTVNGVRTRNNNCEVTLNVTPRPYSGAPLPVCKLDINPSVAPYKSWITLDWDTENVISAQVSPTNGVGALDSSELPLGSRTFRSYYGTNYSMRVWNIDGIWTDCSANFKEDAAHNAPPVADDLTFSMNGAGLQANLLARDLENDPLSFSIKSPAAKGVVVLTDPATGAFSYTPNTGVSGYDSFTFAAHDGAQDSNTAVVRIKISDLQISGISAGLSTNCAVFNKGQIKCWGFGGYGALGNGGNASKQLPTLVSNIDNALEVSAGFYNACARLSNGSVKCWGRSTYGEMGNGARNNEFSPVTVSGIGTAVQISGKNQHYCALLADGSVTCWGRGLTRPTYHSDLLDQLVPTTVPGLSDVSQVSIGFYHGCALLSSGRIKCWGYGGYGALGNGSTDNQSDEAMFVTDINNAVHISSGETFSCAILADKTVKCWGTYNLTNGTPEEKFTPFQIDGINSAKSISLGKSHACALLDNGNVSCWGLGFAAGQLFDVIQPVPTITPDLNSVTQLDAGHAHNCALLLNGTVKCWGTNLGHLGDGTFIARQFPVEIPGLY